MNLGKFRAGNILSDLQTNTINVRVAMYKMFKNFSTGTGEVVDTKIGTEC